VKDVAIIEVQADAVGEECCHILGDLAPPGTDELYQGFVLLHQDVDVVQVQEEVARVRGRWRLTWAMIRPALSAAVLATFITMPRLTKPWLFVRQAFLDKRCGPGLPFGGGTGGRYLHIVEVIGAVQERRQQGPWLGVVGRAHKNSPPPPLNRPTVVGQLL
jgi:hypothetical protein